MNSIQAWRLWRTWLRATKAPDTVRTFAGNVHRFIAETDSLDDVGAYTEDDCTWFFSHDGIVDRGRAKYEYAKALRSFFGWCIRRGFLEVDPMVGITMKKPRRRKPVALTEDEVVRVIVAAALLQSERVAWAVLLVYLLALRRIEAAGLRWDHVVDTARGPAIEIRHTKDQVAGEGADLAPLSPLALECLARLRELPPPAQCRLGPEYVLRVRRATITRWVHDAATAAALEPRKIGAHRLRAAMATNMLRAGVDIRAVQRTLRHLHLSSTEWYVEEAADDEVRQAQELMTRRLSSKPAA